MMRIGQSTDIHRLVENRKLILGGVEIESDLGLLGHSDADALTHAIAEAIFGALALGDLGHWFPDTDPKWEGVDSPNHSERSRKDDARERLCDRQCRRAGHD